MGDLDIEGLRIAVTAARPAERVALPAMRQAGISDYEGLAREIIGLIPDRTICFEAFADEFGDGARIL